MKLASGETLAQTELGVPVIAAGLYFARIESTEVKPNKSGDGQNLVVNFTLLQDGGASTTFHKYEDDSEVVNRGQFRLTDYVSLTIKGNYTEELMNQNLKRYALALGKDETEDLLLEDLQQPETYVKLQVSVREKHTDDQAREWPARNEVKKVLPIRDTDNFDSSNLPPF